MIEKALIVIIFMYSVSFSLVGVQFLFGDILGREITTFQGVAIANSTLQITNQTSLNTITSNVTSTDPGTITSDPITAAAQIAYQMFLILTGTYVFNLLGLVGVPQPFIVGMVFIYVILMVRAIIGYLRGV